MVIGEIAVALAFAWLALTLLFQFRPLSYRYQTFDRLGLLPRWLFFTQGIGTQTLAVEMRVRDASGQIGMWEPVLLGPAWRWWHAIFYPDHALSGALWLAADRLSRRAQRGDSTATLAGTQAFVTLQSHLQRQNSHIDLQFAVLRSDTASDHPKRVFVSEFVRA